MKILLIHIYYSPKDNGANAIVFSTYDSLEKHGHIPYIFATDTKPYIDASYPYIKYFPKSIDSWDTSTILGFWHKKIKRVYNKEAADKLALMLDEIKPDIVHIHTVWELSYSIIKPIKKRNIPIVYTAHDPQISCPAIFSVGLNFCYECKGFNTFPCFFKRCENHNIVQSACTAVKACIDRYFFSLISDTDVIITPSQALADFINKNNTYKQKIFVVSNPINDNFIKKITTNSKQDYFLFVGYLGRQKGVDVLLKAIKDLPKEIPFKIIGSGNDEKIFKNYAKENNLTNVEFLGNMDREDIIKYYQNCISIIVPSNWFENFPTVVLESFASSKPAIGSMVGGIPEQIEHDKTGLLFEPGNVEQLKECIFKYWSNKNLALEHGKNAKNKVIKNYSEELYYERLINIYEGMLKNAKSL